MLKQKMSSDWGVITKKLATPTCLYILMISFTSLSSLVQREAFQVAALPRVGRVERPGPPPVV